MTHHSCTTIVSNAFNSHANCTQTQAHYTSDCKHAIAGQLCLWVIALLKALEQIKLFQNKMLFQVLKLTANFTARSVKSRFLFNFQSRFFLGVSLVND
jgi:hypothetical protein